jgi:hypothetical protein
VICKFIISERHKEPWRFLEINFFVQVLNLQKLYAHNSWLIMNRPASLLEKSECSSLLVLDRRLNNESSNNRGFHFQNRLSLIVGNLFVIFAVGALIRYHNVEAMRKDDPINLKEQQTSFLVGVGGGSHGHDKMDERTTYCDDGEYSKRTLQLAYEMPFAALFKDNKASRKFEGSSVTISEDKTTLFAVCDSSWDIPKIGIQLHPLSDANILIGDVNREEGDESGYEAIFLDEGISYVVRESIDHDALTTNHLNGYHAIVEELVLGNETYDVKEKCSAEFEFEGDSKGFEGAVSIRDGNDTLTILALCESNHCSEKASKKRDVGNGRLVIMQKGLSNNNTCIWFTVILLHLPKGVAFRDYSDIAISPSGKVLITSQEDSQVWVGQLLGQRSDGLWDLSELKFDEQVGTVFDFPKDNLCNTIYCNIEGIEWINDDMVVAVSDKMKGHGKQDSVCFDKDQSVHVFMLPE